jgi:hypothetical protein
MIQRKQTIYLILSFLAFITLFVFPFASFQIGTEVTCNISILKIQNMEYLTTFRVYFAVIQILATLFLSLIGVAIFLYKKRPLQIRLCAFAFITNILMIGALFLTSSKIADVMTLVENVPISYLWPAYGPIVTLLLIMMAQRAIRKDEAMVQSLNRLR